MYLALGALGPLPGTEPVLVECLERESALTLQAACAQALGSVGTPAALDRLIALARSDKPVIVKARAIDALGAFSDPRAVTVLASLAASAGPALRPRALAALGRTGRAEAVDPLLGALAKNPSDEEAVLVLRALARIGAPQAAAPLSRLLDITTAPLIRYEATTALAAIRGGDLGAVLIAQLDDPTPAVRLAAIDGLRRRGEKRASAGLIRLAERELERIGTEPLEAVARAGLAAAALAAIHEIDAPAGTDVLLRAARRAAPADTDPPAVANASYQLRRVAWYGLGYTASVRAVEFLASSAALDDPDPRLRAVAVRSLGVLGARAVLGRQLGLLRDPEAEVRWTAAEAFGLVRVRGATPALLKALDDPHALVRAAAAEALGVLADPAARARLGSKSTADPDDRVRNAAALALRLIETRPR